MMDKLRRKAPRTKGRSMACIVADFKPLLQGWLNYFKHTPIR